MMITTLPPGDEREPLLDAPRVGTHAGMTRTQQTLALIGAMFAVLGGYIAYDRIANPNLDGLSDLSRCDYWSYYRNHGGNVDACRMQVEQDIARYG